jgi:RNA polymerase sigma-70 factor (sigma-E family)
VDDGEAGGVDVERDFTAFVIAHEHRLRRVAYLICRDLHRGEDIVQNVLIRLFLHWKRIDREDGVFGYALKAVTNAAIDEKRRPWRREHPVPDARELADQRIDPEQVADDARTSALSRLDLLPPRQRAVIILRYVEDLDVETTARILGISNGTVKSQSARALDALRSHAVFTPRDAREEGGIRDL